MNFAPINRTKWVLSFFKKSKISQHAAKARTLQFGPGSLTQPQPAFRPCSTVPPAQNPSLGLIKPSQLLMKTLPLLSLGNGHKTCEIELTTRRHKVKDGEEREREGMYKRTKEREWWSEKGRQKIEIEGWRKKLSVAGQACTRDPETILPSRDLLSPHDRSENGGQRRMLDSARRQAYQPRCLWKIRRTGTWGAWPCLQERKRLSQR